MNVVVDKASELSGVSNEKAFALDTLSPSLYARLGHDTFVALSTEFYNRVYADEETWFADIFATSDKMESIQNQYEFFIQRMGGPSLYSDRKGHPALIGRHRPFVITQKGAERWMFHMTNAANTIEKITSDPEAKEVLLNFLHHTAYFIHGGNEMTRKQDSR